MKKLFNIILLFIFFVNMTEIKAEDKVQDLAEIRTDLAAQYLKAGQYKTAIISADEAIKINPRYAQAYMMRAIIYQTVKVDGQAEKDYRSALSIDPGNAYINNNFGWFLCERNRAEESLVYFRRALSDPFYATPEMAYLNLGICLGRLNKIDEAVEQITEALRKSPMWPNAFKELARLYEKKGNMRMAMDFFGKFAMTSTNFSEEDILLGINIYRKGGDNLEVEKYTAVLRQRYPYTNKGN